MQSRDRMPAGLTQVRILKAYFKEIDFVRLEEKELVRLIKRIQENNKKSDISTLCKKFQPVIIKWAKAFRYRGVSFLDLIQQGNIGLLKAMYKYELGHGAKFITYAGYWVRAEMFRITYRQAALGIFNASMARDKSRIFGARRHIEKCHRIEATLEHIAELANLPLNRVKDCQYLSKEMVMPLVSPSEFTRFRHGLMEEDIIDHAAVKPDKKILLQEIMEQMSDFQPYFKERDLDIFYQSAILGCNLTEIGLQYGLCRERVRQIRDEVQTKIRLMLLVSDLGQSISPRDRDIFLRTLGARRNIPKIMAKYNLTRRQVGEIRRSVRRRLERLASDKSC